MSKNPIAPRCFNPTRLRMALAIRCLSRQEFAVQFGFPDEFIRPLCLRGEFPEPDNATVEQIAAALRWPPRFFYQGNDDNMLDDALIQLGITFRPVPGQSKSPWEIVCDRCDEVVAKGSTEEIAYSKAEKAGLLRAIRVGYEKWDLCARCAFEAPHLFRVEVGTKTS